MKAVDTMRASPQSHHTPQTGRPQIMPVTRVSPVNTTPISIAEAETRSAVGFRVIRYQSPPARPTASAA